MITLYADAKYGYGGKQFIAQLVGRSSKFVFEREFLGRKQGKRNDQTVADIDTPGLYEVCDIDRKGNKDSSFYVILRDADGEPQKYGVNKADAMKIAKRLEQDNIDAIVRLDDDGDIVIMSPAEARKAAATATLESTVDHCWEMLQSLPEKEAKKVLTALRKLINPPKVDQPAQ